jgi:Tol biopolymer transport system component
MNVRIFGFCMIIACGVTALWGGDAHAQSPPGGSLLVSAQTSSSIAEVDIQTGGVTDFVPSGAGGLSAPQGAAFGPDGHLYVTSSFTNSVLRFDGTTGAFLGVFATTPASGIFDGTFGPDGHLYLLSNLGRVLRFHGVTGAPLPAPGQSGAEFASGLVTPRGLVFDAAGHLLVTDAATHRIEHFDGVTGASLGPLTSGGLLNTPHDLTFGPDGNLYVANYLAHSVLRFNPQTGALLDTFVPSGSGGLALPIGIVFGPDGRLYVGSQGTNQVLRYNGTTGAGEGVLAQIAGGANNVTWLVVRPAPRFTLTVTRTGPGSVTSVPMGIDCGSDCSEAYPSDTLVTLTASPDVGAAFAGWSGGGCSDTGPCLLTLTADTAVTATFTLVPPGPVTTVSQGVDGAPADGASAAPRVSADGRYTVFASGAANLVAGGAPPGGPQVYRFDRQRRQTRRVSQTAAGQPGDGPSGDPVVSADGRYVAYPTLAPNLTGAASGMPQVVRTDLDTGETVLVSQGPGGPGTAPSRQPTMTGDGNRIAFVAGDGLDPACANGVDQIHLRDVAAGTTRCLSVDATGQPGTGPSFDPVLSQDGTTLAFATQATNLLFGPGAAAATAPGGRGAAGRGLMEPLSQVVQKSTAVGASLATLLSQGATGALGNGASQQPTLSADGKTVAFSSTATNLVPECGTGTAQVLVQSASGMTCASRDEGGTPGDAPSTQPALSGDGLILVWVSPAQNLARGLTGPAGLPQILRTNLGLQNAVVELLSQAGGTAGNGGSTKPSIDFAGQVTVFQTGASNLAMGDTNGQDDVLLVVVAFAPPGMPDRVRITSPASGSAFPLTTPTPLTITWTERAGAARYALEFTGADRVFTNPNGTAPDAVNGFGGAGGVVLVSEPQLGVTLGPGFPAGLYQVRVVALSDTLELLGRFSDAATLALGPVPPGNGRVAITQPAAGAVLTPGQRVTFLWGALPAVASYFFEFTGAGGQFTNPNGTELDPANSVGGALIVASTGFETTVPALPSGVYQVRVIGRTAAGAFVGTFSDAVAVTIP